MPGSPGETVIQAPEKAFNTNKLVIWWQNAIGQRFGKNDEKGTDFDMPFNTPVGAFEGGQVVYAGLPPESKVPGHTSLGYVVQIKNVDGSILHYQHLTSIAPGLTAGSIVGGGQVIGNSGGMPATGQGWYGSGGACPEMNVPTYHDCWTTGPHIEVRYSPTYNAGGGLWEQNWQDPLPYFQKLGASFKPGTVGKNTVGNSQGDTGQQSDAIVSSNCAPWDIGCLLSSVAPSLRSWGVRIGLFILGMVLLIFGFLLIVRPDMADAVKLALKGGAV